MSIVKISAIVVGALTIAAGGSAAVATRDKWWPGERSNVVQGADPDSPDQNSVKTLEPPVKKVT